MDVLFPFGFPWPTALYLTLYVLTLTLHMLLMHYVLAGSAWVAASSFFTAFKSSPTRPSKIIKLLQDWLPFALGGAITAGVAPLLFVQILYQREFYTANLLLFHRWMSILPVLIVAFYLLYLQKSKWLEQRRPQLRPFVWLIIVACFGFVGYSWTENHLLSLQSQDVWTNFFADREIFFASVQILPRLSIWFAGAFSTLCMILAWQVHVHRGETASDPRAEAAGNSFDVRTLSRVGMASIALTILASGIYGSTLKKEILQYLFSGLAWPYVVGAVIGWIVQFAVWLHLSKVGTTARPTLFILTTTVVTTAVSLNVLREVVRLAQVDVVALQTRHAEAASVGGLGVFTFFLVLNSLVIVWLVRSVAKSK